MIWPSIGFDISLQTFKKRLEILWLQMERKRSKEYLVIICAGNHMISIAIWNK